MSAANRTRTENVVIPLVAEELHIEKLAFETDRVRVTTRVESETLHVEAPEVSEELAVERVPVNRVVDGPIAVRQDGDTTIVSVVEEVVVLQKQFVLKEEVRVTKRRVETMKQADVTVLRQVASVERVGPPGRTGTNEG